MLKKKEKEKKQKESAMCLCLFIYLSIGSLEAHLSWLVARSRL